MSKIKCNKCGFTDSGNYCSQCGSIINHTTGRKLYTNSIAKPIIDYFYYMSNIFNPLKLVQDIRDEKIHTGEIISFLFTSSGLALALNSIFQTQKINPKFDVPLVYELSISIGLYFAVLSTNFVVYAILYIFSSNFNKIRHLMMISCLQAALFAPFMIVIIKFQEMESAYGFILSLLIQIFWLNFIIKTNQYFYYINYITSMIINLLSFYILYLLLF
jgi:hypothetical protein